MPELPEVETVRRQLAAALEGRRLDAIEVLDPRWCEPAPPSELAAALEGRRIEAIQRRGKYLIVRLADEVALVMHLRMTGTLLLVTAAEDTPERRHVRVRMTLSRRRGIAQSRLLFADPRRFGTGIVLLGDAALEEYFAARLGVEPLSPEFTAEALRALAAGRRSPTKAFLLNQERIAGVGNIYADEALFRARIHPLRPVGTLRRLQVAALRDAVVEALQLGVDSRGATIDDFRDPDGVSGTFQDRFLVHLREGEPCVRCGTPVRKLRAAGRGTYICPRCQPKPRNRVTARLRPSRQPATPPACQPDPRPPAR